LLEIATENHRAGNLADARRLYAQVLENEPANELALFRSGLLELQEQRPEAALELIVKAAALSPAEPRFQFGLGQALQTLGRWDEAANAYRRVLQSEPHSFDAHLALGAALQRGGQLEHAAAAYREALAIRPDDPGALGNLGTVLRERGDLGGAIRLLEAAERIEPGAASHAVNLGIAYCEQGDYSKADAILGAVRAREPSNAEAAFNRGNALRGLGRTREALAEYRHAAEVLPGYAEALNNLGNSHKELGEFGAAMAAYQAALLARPRYVNAINNAGCLLRTLGRSDEAEDMLRRGLAVDAHHAALHDNLGNVLKDAGELDEAIACYRRSLAIDPYNAATHSNLAYALSFQSLGPEPILAECREWNRRHAQILERMPIDPDRDFTPGRRLKVGYVSADFRDHCQSLFTLPLFAHHDHCNFEIYCYSSVERVDAHTRAIASHADHWRDVRLFDDMSLCRMVRDDRIDLLVDLTMHMANGRPLAFAHRPAPVQIAWLAYPGTTGIKAIDYRLSDARLDPQGFEAHYSERTLLLEDSFWCYDPLTDRPEVNPLPALSRSRLMLGCLNNPCKLTGETLHLWGNAMRALPETHITLMAPAGRHRDRLLQRLGERGVAAHRVHFVDFRPRAEYLRSYHDIDFGLDTFPYNGHTTSLDALWMGVPTVTRIGATSVGRGGLSQLHHLGLSELAAETDEIFVERAVALARDLPRLAALRQSLRARMQRSALMDAPRFARSIESAYRRAWTETCASSAALPAR